MKLVSALWNRLVSDLADLLLLLRGHRNAPIAAVPVFRSPAPAVDWDEWEAEQIRHGGYVWWFDRSRYDGTLLAFPEKRAETVASPVLVNGSGLAMGSLQLAGISAQVDYLHAQTGLAQAGLVQYLQLSQMQSNYTAQQQAAFQQAQPFEQLTLSQAYWPSR